MEAIALFSRPEGEFEVLLTGKADKVVLESLKERNEIFGLKLFAMVSAVKALGGSVERQKNDFVLGQQRGLWGHEKGLPQGAGDSSYNREFP